MIMVRLEVEWGVRGEQGALTLGMGRGTHCLVLDDVLQNGHASVILFD